MPNTPSASDESPKRQGFWQRYAQRIVAVGGALVVTAVGLILHRYAIGDELTNLSYDLPFILRGSRASSTDTVRIVYMDELVAGKRGDMVSGADGVATIDRQVYAQLIRKLKDAGAKMIVIDVIFDRPSKESQGDASADTLLADAMEKYKPEIGVILAAGRVANKEPVLVPVLCKAATDCGLVMVQGDGPVPFVRKLEAGTEGGDAMAWVAARRRRGDEKMPAESGALFTEGWINYYGETGTIAGMGYDRVLDEKTPSAIFSDKVVFIGERSIDIGDSRRKDQFATPWSHFRRAVPGGAREVRLMEGVEVLANKFLNLVREEWLTRVNPTYEITLLVLCGILFGGTLCGLWPWGHVVITGVYARRCRTVLGTIAAAIVITVAGCAIVWWSGQWFAWMIPACVQAPLGLGITLLSWDHLEHGAAMRLSEEKRKLRAAVGPYVSPQMLEHLEEHSFNIPLPTERREVVLMFTDLKGFAEMSAQFRSAPETILRILKDYFERVTPQIVMGNGVVIKYIGDAIFAAWGVFKPDPQMAERAAEAAIQLFKYASLVVHGKTMRTRMGLNLGTVMAGNLGGTERFDYTMVGDAVNLAQRLDSANDQIGTSILMTGEMQKALEASGRFLTRRIGRFEVKGREGVVENVHELIGFSELSEHPAWMQHYRAALKEFEYGDLTKATALFEQTSRKRGEADPPSDFFRRYIAELDSENADGDRPRTVVLRGK